MGRLSTRRRRDARNTDPALKRVGGNFWRDVLWGSRVQTANTESIAYRKGHEKLEREEQQKDLRTIREEIRGNGFQWHIGNLPFTNEQKEVIVEYLAVQLFKILTALGMDGGGWKWYDPLLIKDGQALSYVFDLGDGGRRHAFKDLSHLEQMLIDDVAQEIRAHFQEEE